MKILKKIILSLAFLVYSLIFCLPSAYAQYWWDETSSGDWADGIFHRSTATANSLQISSFPDWYDAAWQYRAVISIDSRNQTTNLFDYPVSVTTNTAVLISALKMKGDCSDVRFCDSNGTTVISHYMSTGPPNSQFWVKIPSISSGTIKDIYMYYGNPAANTTSTRYALDDFYEDWEPAGIIDPGRNWDTVNEPPNSCFFRKAETSIAQDRVYEGNYSVCNSTIQDNETAVLTLTNYTALTNSQVLFYWMTVSETNNDILTFSIDGNPKKSISGAMSDWKYDIFDLTAGNHSLKWSYSKDGGGRTNPDRGWLDAISIRKSTTTPPIVQPGYEETIGKTYHTTANYYSNVLNSGGENTKVTYSSWTFTGSVNNVKVYMRARNQAFNPLDDTPVFAEVTNSTTPSMNRGRYIQYKVFFSSDGFSTPSLTRISIKYSILPDPPTNFRAIARSTTTVEWLWQASTMNVIEFRIYSSTRGYPGTGFIEVDEDAGLVTALSPDTTSWIERGLAANESRGRFVVAYNNQVGGNAGTRYDGQNVSLNKYSMAVPPQVNSEYYYDDTLNPESIPNYIKISSGIWSTDKYFKTIFTHPAPSGNFTSDISSGIGKFEYYRILFATYSVTDWLVAGSTSIATKWIPLSSVVQELPDGDNVTKRPEILLAASLNRDSWYLNCASFNGDEEISTSVVLGPFFFNGSPSYITDLTAVPSIEKEGNVVLSWTAPSGDSTFGNLAGTYILKYKPSQFLVNSTEFNSLVLGLNIATSSVLGQNQKLLVTGLTPGTTYSFALKCMDSDNNISEMSVNLIDIFLARTRAAKVAKIVVTQVSAETFRVGESVQLTIEAQDSNGNHLKVDQNTIISLASTSNGLYGGIFNQQEGSEDNLPIVQFIKDEPVQSYRLSFFYKDRQSGTPTITCFDPRDPPQWSPATHAFTVIPGLATQFKIIFPPGNGRIGIDTVRASIRAMDSYNNVSDKYMGSFVSSYTPAYSVSQVNPSTHTYSSTDLGMKDVYITNNYYAGPTYLTVQETTDENFNKVFFHDSDTGWTVGDKGSVRKTLDGGDTWITQVFGTSTANGLNAGCVVANGSSYIGFAVGKNGLIKRTTDMSLTWIEQNSGTNETLNSTFFVDYSTGFAVGTTAKVMKSTDSGKSWADSNSGISGSPELRAIYFIDESAGFIVGNGVAYKTSDLGNTWVPVFDLTGIGMLNAVKFIDTNTGFAVGANGKIYKTSNGGISWGILVSTTTSDLYDIAFRNDGLNGMAVGINKTLLKTIDGGINWAVIPTSKTLYGADFTDSAIAVGNEGTFIKSSYQGGTNWGDNWGTYVMKSQPTQLNWNGTVLTPASARNIPFVQGRRNQYAAMVSVRTLYPGTCRWEGISIQKTTAKGTLDSEIDNVKLFRDNNGDKIFNENNDGFISAGQFSGPQHLATLAFDGQLTRQLINNATANFFIVFDLSTSAEVGHDLGFTIPRDLFEFDDTLIRFSRNNLPYDFTPLDIIPSSVTVILEQNDLAADYAPGAISSETIKQGTKDIPMLSLRMHTDAAGRATQWKGLMLTRSGENIDWQDISAVNVYYGQIGSAYLLGQGSFDETHQNTIEIRISTPQIITSDLSEYFFVTLGLNPESLKYSQQGQDVTCGFYLYSSTAYIKLINMMGEEGLDGIQPSNQLIATSNVRINQAKNSVTFNNPNPLIVPYVKQSNTEAFLNFHVSIDSNIASWMSLKVLRAGSCSDSDIDEIALYRDADGNNTFSLAIDSFVGSGIFESGVSNIRFPNPENINRTFPNYMTYFVTLRMSKRAGVGKDVVLSIPDNTNNYLTLGGADKVLPSNFPIISSTATITDFNDVINPVITDITPLPPEARVDQLNVGVLKLDLTTYCDASWKRLGVSIDGNAGFSAVSTVKLFKDTNGNGILDPLANTSPDVLISSAIFDYTGNAVLIMPDATNFDSADRNQLRYTSSTLIVETTQAFFIAYDLNESSAIPNKILGAWLDNTGFSYNLPNAGATFGVRTSNKFTLLDIRTPDVPVIHLKLAQPVPARVGEEFVYFTNNKFRIDFDWDSKVDSGIEDIGVCKYTLASRPLVSSADTPDITLWSQSALQDISYTNLNLSQNTSYYLWIEVSNKDYPQFTRRNQVKFKTDLTPPAGPVSPKHDTSGSVQASEGSLIVWEPVIDLESGILSYELQERNDTSPLWITVSSCVPGNQSYYLVTNMQSEKFYYYRLRAQNYTGDWGNFSATSDILYSSLPLECITQLSNYPNPFDSRYDNTTITYLLREDAEVKIRILDLFGAVVRTIYVSKGTNPGGAQGNNNIVWDGTNDRGEKLAQGMYIMVVEARAGSQTIRKKWKIGIMH